MEGFSKAFELSSSERSCMRCAFRADCGKGSLESGPGRESRCVPLHGSLYNMGQMRDHDLSLSVAIFTEQGVGGTPHFPNDLDLLINK